MKTLWYILVIIGCGIYIAIGNVILWILAEIVGIIFIVRIIIPSILRTILRHHMSNVSTELELPEVEIKLNKEV